MKCKNIRANALNVHDCTPPQQSPVTHGAADIIGTMVFDGPKDKSDDGQRMLFGNLDCFLCYFL